MENHLKKMPSPLLSLVPILVLVALLFVTIRTFGSDALSGGSQVVLLTTTAVASLLAMIFCKVKWRDIEEAICKNILGVATAIIILLLIGALSGSWMISGIVPTLIYYGMQIIHPSFFLASCCVICAVVSVMTGSSWTTIATIGIALMGIGEAQGFATGWVAGAIISGAYFGDKISALGHDGISFFRNAYPFVLPYPVYDAYDNTVYGDHVDYLYHSGFYAYLERIRANSRVRRLVERKF